MLARWLGRRGRRWGLVLACTSTAAIVGPLAWLWQDSLLPDSYSVMDMGYADGGGALPTTHAGHDHGGTDVTTLIEDPDRPADVAVTLIARQERFEVATGGAVAGYTFNGTSPGPTIRATVGDLVEVRLVNISVEDGVAVHWHGVDVPGAEDGVAGVTQDAVPPGGEFTYRFVVDQPGTYWYHSHQLSDAQVTGGLLGALVVDPLPGATP